MNATPANTVIYPAQSIITLVSRAWNLFKANFKSSILIILPAILLLTVIHMIVSMLSAKTFLTPTSINAMRHQLMVVLTAMILSVPNLFMWVFSGGALSRLYYSAIVGEKPLTPKECWAYVGKKWLTYLLLTIGLGICSFISLAISLTILIAGLFFCGMLIVAVPASLSQFGNGAISGVMLLMSLLLFGFVILALFISLATFQNAFFGFPLLALSTDPTGKTEWWPLVKHACKLMFDSFPRLVLFGLAQLILFMTMSAVLMSPAIIWMVIELTRLGVSQQYHLPMHIQVVLNIWSSFANLLLAPFFISSLTLLWYDCQVRKDGLDLRLWFNQLVRRHGQQPEDYNTVAEPQPIQPQPS